VCRWFRWLVRHHHILYNPASDLDLPRMEKRIPRTIFSVGVGSVTSLSNAAGALAQTYAFDSFGNTKNSSGSLTNPFQYTAREFDTETSLYYYRARYFDPASGRFGLRCYGGYVWHTSQPHAEVHQPRTIWSNPGRLATI